MRAVSFLPVVLIFLAAAGVSVIAANGSVSLIEARSEIGVRGALDREGLTWAEVAADGLQVTLLGEARTKPCDIRP